MKSASPITRTSDKGDRLLVVALCAALLAAFLLSLPFRRIAVGFVPPFLGIYSIVLTATEVLTSLLLAWRARSISSGRLALLAAAYGYAAPLILANMLTLPTLGYGGSEQLAPWMWLAWRAGWALIILPFSVVREWPNARPFRVALLGLLASAVTIGALLSVPRLPALVDAHHGSTPLMLSLNVGTVVVELFALAALALRRRTSTNLELSVIVAVAASALDTLANAASGVPFSLGFYVGRGLGMVAGCAVVVALFGDFVQLVRRADLLEAYAESERRLRTVLEAVPQIVWTADATGWVDWYNRRWYAYTRQTRAESAGWGWQAAHHPEDFLEVMERWSNSIATGKPFEMEFRLRRHDGVFEWFLTRVVPERDETGRIARWYGTNTNIDAQKREMERSARVAQIMQDAFLPESFPRRPNVIFDALYLPAESDALVGGDWYDVTKLPDDRVLISCGDIAGHGLHAAVLAGRYRQSIAFSALEDPDPGRMLQRVNRVAVLQEEALATVVVAIVDFTAGTLAYGIAGHPPPAIAAADGARILRNGGLPLGILPDAAFETHVVPFGADSVVVFYTDGITEFAREPLDAEPKVLAAAQRLRERPVEQPAAMVKRFVMGDAVPRDDVAIFVLQRIGTGAVNADLLPISKSWRFHSSDALTAHNARRALAEFLATHAADDDELYPAELIIGEAIANTVEHAPGLVEVFVDWSGERPVLTVRDTGPGLDRRERVALPHALDEDGRGLFLIHTLADDVTMENALGFGMQLRCTLPLHRKRTVTA